MKLAEALIQRADYQTRLEQLKQRVVQNARIQDGEQPAEDPESILAEIERVAAELTRVIQQINRTNLNVQLADGRTLTDALAVRDVLRIKYAVYRELGQAASIRRDRLSRSEIIYRSTVAVKEIQQKADDIAREYRELDARIQEANWMADLME
jgi:hypothetical protein